LPEQFSNDIGNLSNDSGRQYLMVEK